MNIDITANGNSIAEYIAWESVDIEDKTGNRVNSCCFYVDCLSCATYSPALNDEIIVYDDTTKLFAGKIYNIQKSIVGGVMLRCEITCYDYTKDLERYVVTEKFDETAVDDIVETLLLRYDIEHEFTITNVDCTEEIDTIAFIHIPLNQVLQRIADRVGYQWYVDYDKDIHFFLQEDNQSPFDITDASGNLIFKSLKIREDMTRLKNKIRIRGQETITATERTETFDGDASKTTFRLGYKFAERPTVVVDSVEQVVGIEFLTDDGQADVLWSYNEKYLRFVSAPGIGSDNIVVSGIPLLPVVVDVLDVASIGAFGYWEHYIKDATIRSEDEAEVLGSAELAEYKASLNDGSFDTYEDGLRSGQEINITSTIFGVSEDYVIQSVRMRMRGKDDGIFSVVVASKRKYDLIDVLQKLIMKQNEGSQEELAELLYHLYSPTDTGGVADDYYKRTGATYTWVLGGYYPSSPLDPSLTDAKRSVIIDKSFYVY